MDLTAYIRVSTENQAKEDKNGKDVQKKACRAFAREHGHRIVSWRYDDGKSGADALDVRIGLAEALGDIKDGTSKGIVVYRLDRLARDLIVQETLLAEIRKTGGQPFTTSKAEAEYLADDPNDPSRKLIRQILGAVNEYEKSMIGLRLKSGRRMKAEKGGFAYGSPAFGQVAQDKALVPNAAEQAVIERIRELDGKGTSIRAICAGLNAEGIPSKRGGKWHPQTVARVLNRTSAA